MRHVILSAAQEAGGKPPTVRKLSGIVGAPYQSIYQHLLMLLDLGFVEVQTTSGRGSPRIGITERGILAVTNHPSRNGSKE